MKVCLKIALCFVLMVVSFAETIAQQSNHQRYNARARHAFDSPRYDDGPSYRVARRQIPTEPSSVLSASAFSEPTPVSQQPEMAGEIFRYDSHSGRPMNYAVGHEGPYPYVTGDIFGICREGICDEWYGHCACLELTNSRSNCECTNKRRAHWGLSDSVHGGCSSCSSCDDGGWYGYSPGYDQHEIHETSPRTARRRTVSEYFHPKRR